MNPSDTLAPQSLQPGQAYVKHTKTGGNHAWIALGRTPLNIGSAPSCGVRLPGGPPVAAALRFESGVVSLENIGTRKVTALRHGSRLQCQGSVVEVVMGAAEPAPAAAANGIPAGSGQAQARSSNQRRLALAQLHGLVILSVTYLAFVLYLLNLLREPLLADWLQERFLAVFVPVTLVYLAYVVVAAAICHRASTRRLLSAVILAVSSLVAVGLGASLVAKIGPISLTKTPMVWLALPVLVGICAAVVSLRQAPIPTVLPPGLPNAAAIASYNQIPWYRRSAVNTAFILAGVLSYGLLPGVQLVCLHVLTGDIYSRGLDLRGQLRTWHWSNKIAAAILLLGSVAVWIRLGRLATGY